MIKNYFANIFLIFSFQFIVYSVGYSLVDDADNKNNKYTITHTLNKNNFSRDLPDSITKFYKEKYNNCIPVNKLFLEPIKLLMLYELLKETIDTLNKYKVDYWLIGETLIYAQKLNSFAPWQKSTHIGVNYDQCRVKIQKISADLQKKGIIFRCFENILNLKNPSYLLFSKDGFTNVIKKHDPSHNSLAINAKYNSLDNQVSPISLCIVPYKVTETNTYSLVPDSYDGYIKKTVSTESFATSDIYPLNNETLLDLTVNIPNNIDTIINLYEYGKSLYKLYIGRKGQTYYMPIILEDVREHPEFRLILQDFLEFTFNKLLD